MPWNENAVNTSGERLDSIDMGARVRDSRARAAMRNGSHQRNQDNIAHPCAILQCWFQPPTPYVNCTTTSRRVAHGCALRAVAHPVNQNYIRTGGHRSNPTLSFRKRRGRRCTHVGPASNLHNHGVSAQPANMGRVSSRGRHVPMAAAQ